MATTLLNQQGQQGQMGPGLQQPQVQSPDELIKQALMQQAMSPQAAQGLYKSGRGMFDKALQQQVQGGALGGVSKAMTGLAGLMREGRGNQQLNDLAQREQQLKLAQYQQGRGDKASAIQRQLDAANLAHQRQLDRDKSQFGQQKELATMRNNLQRDLQSSRSAAELQQKKELYNQKHQQLMGAGVEPGSVGYNEAMFGITQKVPTAADRKLATQEAAAAQAPLNIAGGLGQLAGVADDYTKTELENAIGTFQGDDDSIMAAPSRIVGSIFSTVTGGRSPTEVRTRIQGDARALGASIKDIVRKTGEGTWTDADQRNVDAIIGNLTTANSKKEYINRLEKTRQRVRANFGIQVPPIPKVTVEGGMRYMGGDPASPASWRKVGK